MFNFAKYFSLATMAFATSSALACPGSTIDGNENCPSRGQQIACFLYEVDNNLSLDYLRSPNFGSKDIIAPLGSFYGPVVSLRSNTSGSEINGTTTDVTMHALVNKAKLEIELRENSSSNSVNEKLPVPFLNNRSKLLLHNVQSTVSGQQVGVLVDCANEIL